MSRRIRPVWVDLVIAALVALLFTPDAIWGQEGAPRAYGPVSTTGPLAATAASGGLSAGAAAVNITPYTKPGDPLSNDDPDWDGQVTPSGVWGEPFVDTNGNGTWDRGEPFTDDPGNSALDPDSKGKYDGIYLAGFGNGRAATGVYDPLWARTIFFRSTGLNLAWVSLDLIGYMSTNEGAIRAAISRRDPGLKVDLILLTVVHNHEGPDTYGMWGRDEFTDGKYPKYVRYVAEKVAQSIVQAAAAAEPVTVRYGRTDATAYPDLDGLQCRNSLRTPWFFDDELRAMQLLAKSSGKTVATVINWNTHVESLEGKNTKLSSDFVHSLRRTVEEAVGGMAFYVPGDQGAVEIVGDSGTDVWRRDTFDGQTFPVDPKTGRPLDAHYRDHYQETNSASSMLAPGVTTTAVSLWGMDVSRDPACRAWRFYKSALFHVHNPFNGFEWPFKDWMVRHQ